MHVAGKWTNMRLALVAPDAAQPKTGDRSPIHRLQGEGAAFVLPGNSFESSSLEPALLANELNPLPVPGSEQRHESPLSGGPVHNGACCESRLLVQDLVAVSRRKDAFLALLGHELRNPLASIQQAIRVLRAQTGEAARQKTQAMIERQVCRMTRLVNDLQEVSLITQGRVHLHRERVDLCSILRNAIETIQWDINERKHRLTTEMPSDPVWLEGDAGRLEQVFVNLLANASRYTDAGGKLTVCLSAQATQAIVRIRDSGIGIAPDVLPRIFDLYKQGDETDPRSEGGLGVGLALVRHLVQAHGGSISAVSGGHGQGSEFTVCLRTHDTRDGH